MSIIYLLSGPGKSTGFPKKIKEQLKEDFISKKNIVFIPTTPDNFEKNDLYVYGNNESVTGIINYLKEISKLEKIDIIDYRMSNQEAKKSIEEADVLYLLGGNPFAQIEYLREQGYDKLIKKFSGLIIGTSAGAMNLGKVVYCSKDEDFDESSFYKGLGLVDITIDPHFDINNDEQVKEIKINSKKRRIIGLPNESGIRIESNNVEFIDKYYEFIDEKLNNYGNEEQKTLKIFYNE